MAGRWKDKLGNEIPDEAYDGYEGPPDRPNSVLSDEKIDKLVAEILGDVERESPPTGEPVRSPEPPR